MRISLIIEGAYPYVNGGMSNWVQALMLRMPDVEFVIQSIAAVRAETKEFKYVIPDNCVQIQEVYLMDDDYVSNKVQRKITMNNEQYEAFEALLFGNNTDWDVIIRFFAENDVSLNALLSGEDFLSMVLNYYREHFDRIVFTDFLWTMRSMYLPLFTILKSSTLKADLYHSASGGYAGIWAALQKVVYNKPFIMSEHGIYTREREEEIIKAGWVTGVYKDLWIDQFHKIGDCCYQYADVVTSLYSDARQYQLELGCDRKKTIIIPNGMDPERFAHCEGKDPHDRYINVGALLRVSPIKDVKTMISAYALAKQRNPKLKLWIMGDLSEAKDYAAECQQMVHDMGIEDVEFTGVIKASDYIGKMDILMLSSISEGQPLSILEAFTARKPFIATNVGNCKGLIEGEFDNYGPAGIVVPIMGVTGMSQAILRLADDAKLREKMGEAGFKRVRDHYDEEECFNRYKNLYKAVLSNKETWREEMGIEEDEAGA